MAKKSAEEIRTEIAASRQQLADAVETLASQLNPQSLKQAAKESINDSVEQTKESIKMTIQDSTKTVKETFVDEYGVRWDNIGTIVLAGAAIATVIGGLALIGGIARKVRG